MTDTKHRDTDVPQLLDDLDGGVFQQKLARAFSDVAAGVIDQDKKGRVTLSFDFERIGTSHQVKLVHRLGYTMPTMRGKLTEEDTTETPLHVNTGGRLSLFPENQGQLFSRQGEPAKSTQENDQ